MSTYYYYPTLYNHIIIIILLNVNTATDSMQLVECKTYFALHFKTEHQFSPVSSDQTLLLYLCLY